MEQISPLIRFCVVMFVICHAGKTAVPNGSNSNLHSTTVVGNSRNSSPNVTNEFFIEFWREKNKGLCPPGQINQRNDSVCCLPVSCGIGYEVIACLVNGTEDKCKPCDEDYTQMNYVSSLNMLEATCYPKVAEHRLCPIDDMKPSRDNFSHNFPLPCQCKEELCYYKYGSAGTCQRTTHKCEEGHEMNDIGDCVPCQWYAHKHKVGCEPCTHNDTMLRYGRHDGNYVPRTSTVPTTTSTRKQPTDEQTFLETVRTDTSHIQPENNNSTLLVISILAGIIGIVVVVLVVVGICWMNRTQPECFGRRTSLSSRDTQSPLLTPSAPVTPTTGSVLPNGAVTNGAVVNGAVVNGYASPLYNQYTQNALPQNGISHVNNGLITSNGICENGTHTSQQIIYEEHQGQHEGNQPVIDTVRKQPSNSKAMVDETTVKNRPITNYVSIHGNDFHGCYINLSSNKAPLEEVSGSFALDSNSGSNTDHSTNESTVMQPGRRDVYVIPDERKMGNCRPENMRDQHDAVHLQEAQVPYGEHYREAQVPYGERYREEVAMKTLGEPNFPNDTDVVGNNTHAATMSGHDKPRAASGLPQIRPVQIAKVAPMRQNPTRGLPSVRHVSGYPSGDIINQSEHSANSSVGTSVDYGVGHYSTTDIANSSDFRSGPEPQTDPHTSLSSQGTVAVTTDETGVKQIVDNQPQVSQQQTNTVQARVQPVTPLYTREGPDGESGCRGNITHNNGLINDETTREKQVAGDETDVKEYEAWSDPDTDKGMTNSHDSLTDLKKMLKLNENDATCSEIDKECSVNHTSENNENSEKLETEEQSLGVENEAEKYYDDQRDLNCDSQSCECITNTDRNKEEPAGESSVEISGIKPEQVTNGYRLEVSDTGDTIESDTGDTIESDTGDTIEESFEIDNNVVRNVVSTRSETSDGSYELDGDVDIRAIHEENQHVQEITCRGETFNSVQSGYKGFAS